MLNALRFLLKVACIALMGYVGYYLYKIDIAQTERWAATSYPWLETMSRGAAAFLGAFVAGALAWQATDGLLSIMERN
ncbi:MAG: hypothetical protein EP343_12530 [Deltaproteobacteria bacterium]|nr:MAG: hypothetical protein EP343_12530 [Deltaproteobacteria bacterium]